MLKASERRALNWPTACVARINLNHPAEAIWLVRVFVGVKPLIKLVPAIAEPLGINANAAFLL